MWISQRYPDKSMFLIRYHSYIFNTLYGIGNSPIFRKIKHFFYTTYLLTLFQEIIHYISNNKLNKTVKHLSVNITACHPKRDSN